MSLQTGLFIFGESSVAEGAVFGVIGWACSSDEVPVLSGKYVDWKYVRVSKDGRNFGVIRDISCNRSTRDGIVRLRSVRTG